VESRAYAYCDRKQLNIFFPMHEWKLGKIKVESKCHNIYDRIKLSAIHKIHAEVPAFK
jgi:hypothetical protein